MGSLRAHTGAIGCSVINPNLQGKVWVRVCFPSVRPKSLQALKPRNWYQSSSHFENKHELRDASPDPEAPYKSISIHFDLGGKVP